MIISHTAVFFAAMAPLAAYIASAVIFSGLRKLFAPR